MTLQIGDIVEYIGSFPEYIEQVDQRWGERKTAVVLGKSHYNERGQWWKVESGGYSNNYLEHELRVVTGPEYFGVWRFGDGSEKKIKELTRSELKKAIKQLEHNPQDLQRMKIISLQKALEKKRTIW